MDMVIHEQYIDRVAKSKLVEREAITIDQWKIAVDDSYARFFKARRIFNYTKYGYLPIQFTSRRWGDNRKFISTYRIVTEDEAKKVEKVRIDTLDI